MGEVLVTKAGEELFSDIPNFLYRILVSEVIHPEGEVHVFGSTTMLSAAGDLVIQNGNGQRVFGVGTGYWFGLLIVDQETFKPVPEFFPEVRYD